MPVAGLAEGALGARGKLLSRFGLEDKVSPGIDDAPAQARPASLTVQAIILAGAHTWEHDAFECLKCRALLPIASRPLIRHTLRWLRDHGVTGAAICGNSHTDDLRQELGDDRTVGVALSFVVDRMPRGPAGCARDAARLRPADLFVVVEGSIAPQFDLRALLASHRQSEAAVTVVTTAEPRSGASDGPLEPAGVYVFSAEALEVVPPEGYRDIKERLLPELYRRRARIVSHVIPRGLVGRVTGAMSYLDVNMWGVRRVARETAPEGMLRVSAGVWIHATARVDTSARIVGPILIGSGSTVGAGAMIVGPTSVGRDCIIGPGAVISRSAIWDGCQVGASASLDHCVLTDGTRVGPEVVMRNTVGAPAGGSSRSILRRMLSGLRPETKRDGVLKDRREARSSLGLQEEPARVAAARGALTVGLTSSTRPGFPGSPVKNRRS